MIRNCSLHKTSNLRQQCLVVGRPWNKIHINLAISNMYNNTVNNLFIEQKRLFSDSYNLKGIYFELIPS